MTDQLPTTGRVVHYNPGNERRRAAACLLAWVNDGVDAIGGGVNPRELIGLAVAPPAPNGAQVELEQVYVAAQPSDPGEEGWHWPERA